MVAPSAGKRGRKPKESQDHVAQDYVPPPPPMPGDDFAMVRGLEPRCARAHSYALEGCETGCCLRALA